MMRRPAPCAFAVVLSTAGCSGGSPPVAPASSPTAEVAPAPPPGAPVSSAAAPEPPPAPAACADPPPPSPGLIVASEAGVQEVAPDGRVLRTLSRTRAAFPRYLPGRREVVFLVPERGELRRLSLDTCAERAVATLPRDAGLACQGVWNGPYDPVQYIHFDEDFVVDPRGELACARVMDRNLNMSNVHVILQVRLATGEQAHRVSFPDTCAGAPPKDAGFACARVLEQVNPPDAKTPAAPPTQALPFTVVDARSKAAVKGVDPRKVTRLTLEDPTLESASPSGRWAVLSGNRDESDYIYRDLYLFDRQTGQVLPLREGPWPKALTPAQLGDEAALKEAGMKATGETTVRWTGDGDQLLVGGMLVKPGQPIVRLPGELAW